MVPVLSQLPAYAKNQKQAALVVSRIATMKSVKVVVITLSTRALFQLHNDYSIEDLAASSMYSTALDGLGNTISSFISAGKKVVVTVDKSDAARQKTMRFAYDDGERRQ